MKGLWTDGSTLVRNRFYQELLSLGPKILEGLRDNKKRGKVVIVDVVLQSNQDKLVPALHKHQ